MLKQEVATTQAATSASYQKRAPENVLREQGALYNQGSFPSQTKPTDYIEQKKYEAKTPMSSAPITIFWSTEKL